MHSQGAGASAHALGRQRILLIDDEPVVRSVATTLLDRYQVIAVDSGSDGLDAIRAHAEISMVLLDKSTPEMSGRQVMRELVKVRPKQPVLVSAVTAKAKWKLDLRTLKLRECYRNLTLRGDCRPG